MEKADFMTIKQRICLSLGFFDCMHAGHREILSVAYEKAKKNGYTNAVFTFDTRKTPLIKGDDKQIYTFSEREKLFTDCGVERIISYPFDEKVKGTSPKDFLDGLTNDFAVSVFVCGEDYTFGKNGSGTVDFLKEYCDKNGIELIVCPQKNVNGIKISTTMVKDLLCSGNIEKVNSLLETPYFITGEVVRGRGEGHTFGIPTANLAVARNKLLPKNGVYASVFTVDGKEYKSVTNFGKKPTFGDYTDTIETLIGDFEGNLYGKEVKVTLVKYLRCTEKFSSPFELAEQIRKDLSWE